MGWLLTWSRIILGCKLGKSVVEVVTSQYPVILHVKVTQGAEQLWNPQIWAPYKKCAIRVPWLFAVEVGSASFSEEESACLLQFAAVTLCCCHLTEEIWHFAKALCVLLERADVKAKMCGRKNGVASWRDTTCFLESHGEVNCDQNQHEELGWVVCLFVSLKHGPEDSRIGSEFLLQIWGCFASATASFWGVKA